MRRKSLQSAIVVMLVILFSLGCGLLNGTSQPQQMGTIKIVNDHVRGSDAFPGGTGLPDYREYGVCIIAYPPTWPSGLDAPTLDRIIAKDAEQGHQQTTYALPAGAYTLQEFQFDSEINQDPLYSPAMRTLVRPPETVVLRAGQTNVFGSVRTLTAPGDFVEGNPINVNCGGAAVGLGVTPKSKAIYNFVMINVDPIFGTCYSGEKEVPIFGLSNRKGAISWTDDGEFDVAQIPDVYPDYMVPDDVHTEHIHGKVAPDGKSVSIQFDFSFLRNYLNDPDTKIKAEYNGKGSVIDLPFANHVERLGAVYDQFIVTGSPDQLKPYLQFWYQENFIEDGKTDTGEYTYDSVTSCGGPGTIEILLFTTGPY